MISKRAAPRVLLTSGEPAGIGPDLIVKLAGTNHDFDLSVVCDPALLRQRANELSVPVDIVELNNRMHDDINHHAAGQIKVLPIKSGVSVRAGKPDTGNAGYVLRLLDTASDACRAGRFDAMVTTPVQKSIINDAGIMFSGHTEYLAKQCNDCQPVMLLVGPKLRVALVTTHLPLRDVPKAITPEHVERVLRIVLHDMKRYFGIDEPKLAVCGLNPHAGENGHLGDEERKSINPAIESLKAEGRKIIGPLSADTAFRPEQRQNTDVYICMYHDQGLPVLKTLGFGKAVNVTLGLPIIRTSVDHGTALELAGTGNADPGSLIAAINTAREMVRYKNRYHIAYDVDNSLLINE